MITPKVGTYYKHRYGGIYRVQDIAESTVDNSKWVVYVHVYPFDYKVWIRPYDEWVDGRFEPIQRSDYEYLLQTTVAGEYQQVIINNKANK